MTTLLQSSFTSDSCLMTPQNHKRFRVARPNLAPMGERRDPYPPSFVVDKDVSTSRQPAPPVVMGPGVRRDDGLGFCSVPSYIHSVVSSFGVAAWRIGRAISRSECPGATPSATVS